MPMSYTIDGDTQLIRIVGRGRVTDEEMLDCVTTLRTDPGLVPGMRTLSDMREIEVGSTNDGISEMLAVMESTAQRRVAAKAAIVVATDVAFGMGRMLEMLSDDVTDPSFRIFRDLSAAFEWLGIE
jgi:hypothetical protein